MLEYRRTGGHPPADYEVFSVADDGAFQMWRTIARASQPPTPIGRFAGSLTDDELAGLRAAAGALPRKGDLTAEMPPDSAVERITVGRATATLPHSAQPDDPWGAVVARCRSLLAGLTDRPRAALALEVAEDGGSARLVHLGDEELLVDPNSLAVRAVLWHGNEQRGEWLWQGSQEPSDVAAGPGWTMDVPFDHGLDATDGQVAGYVDLQVFAGDMEGWRVCSLQTPR